jgi:hypothetical protein
VVVEVLDVVGIDGQRVVGLDREGHGGSGFGAGQCRVALGRSGRVVTERCINPRRIT